MAPKVSPVDINNVVYIASRPDGLKRRVSAKT
jgi:hypothetical protein